MAKFTRIWAREILDSRGMPTIEAYGLLDSGHTVISSVPSGASTGTYEALELRDGDMDRYDGKGVLTAVNNVNTVIANAIVGKDPSNQGEIDKIMIDLDGTSNKTKLGANSILAVSILTCKAGALVNGVSLYNWVNTLLKNTGNSVNVKIPTPLFNMINGGLHGAGNLDFQEFFVIPGSNKAFHEGLQAGVEIYFALGKDLARRGAIHSIGDEGGYAPNLFTNADALEVLVETIRRSKYNLGRDVTLGLDVASNSFYKNKVYAIKDKSAPMDEGSFIQYYKELNDQYHLTVLEDPLSEDAWSGWKALSETIGSQTIIVGDDLLVTNPKRLEKAIAEKACNGVLVKPNQVGTVSETLNVIKLTRDAGWKVIVSHRSGETNDTFIADFSVGVGADHVKFGAPARGERTVKFNRLSAIELELSQHG